MKRRVLRVSYVCDDLSHQLVMSILRGVLVKQTKSGVVATENTEGHPFGTVIRGGKKGQHVQRAKRTGTHHEGDRDR
jgi:hypothetical protein